MRNALSGVERALFWTLAFAVFAAAAAGLAARAVDRLAASYEAARVSYAIVRVDAPEGPEGVSAAQAALSARADIIAATPMHPQRAAELLGQWGGQTVSAQDLPPLHLIELELTPDADAAAIEAVLANAGVSGELIGAPVAASSADIAASVRAAVLWGAGLFALLMALIVSFTARGLAARRRDWAVVMADCGASKGQAAGRIGGEAALVGLYAGIAGAVLAGAAGFIVLMVAFPGVSLNALRDMILPIDLAPLAAAPFAAAIASGLGARAAAAVFYRQAARLG